MRFAHSIKNPHIIHLQQEYQEGEYVVPFYTGAYAKFRYLCCGSYTPEKATTEESEVTCKNCLREIAAGRVGKDRPYVDWRR